VQQIPLPLMAVRKTLTHLTNHPIRPPVPQPHQGAEKAQPPESPIMALLEGVLHQPMVAGDQGWEGVAPNKSTSAATWRPLKKPF
jgi:hypothetical protein